MAPQAVGGVMSAASPSAWRSRRAANAQTASLRARLRPRAQRHPRLPPIASTASSPTATGALVAPDGAVDWLCVPRFDSPSVFGALLDHQNGAFRFGPFGINVPVARICEPGTNILATTTAHADGLGADTRRAHHGPAPRQGQDHAARSRRPTRTASICSCAWRSASRAASSSSWSANRPLITAARRPKWTLAGDDRQTADATGAGQTIRLRSDMHSSGSRATGSGRGTRSRGRAGLLLALVGRGAGVARGPRRSANARLAATAHFWRDWLARARMPDHRWREAIQRSARRSRASPTCQPTPRSPR